MSCSQGQSRRGASANRHLLILIEFSQFREPVRTNTATATVFQIPLAAIAPRFLQVLQLVLVLFDIGDELIVTTLELPMTFLHLFSTNSSFRRLRDCEWLHSPHQWQYPLKPPPLPPFPWPSPFNTHLLKSPLGTPMKSFEAAFGAPFG